MWQSRHSEVNVCEQTDGLLTFKGPLRSYMICVHVFVCVFCLDLSVQQTLAHNWKTSLPVLSLLLSHPSKTRFRFREHSNRMVALPKQVLFSTNWIFGLWLGLLGVFTTSNNF